MIQLGIIRIFRPWRSHIFERSPHQQPSSPSTLLLPLFAERYCCFLHLIWKLNEIETYLVNPKDNNFVDLLGIFTSVELNGKMTSNRRIGSKWHSATTDLLDLEVSSYTHSNWTNGILLRNDLKRLCKLELVSAPVKHGGIYPIISSLSVIYKMDDLIIWKPKFVKVLSRCRGV